MIKKPMILGFFGLVWGIMSPAFHPKYGSEIFRTATLLACIYYGSSVVLDWLSMLNTHVFWFCYIIPPRLSMFIIHWSSFCEPLIIHFRMLIFCTYTSLVIIRAEWIMIDLTVTSLQWCFANWMILKCPYNFTSDFHHLSDWWITLGNL